MVPHSPNLNPIEHLWDIMFRRQVAPQTVQELSDALVQIWEGTTQDTIRHLIKSMPRCCQACIQAHEGHTNYWVPFWVAAMKFQQNGLACCIIFSLDFRGVFEFSPLWVDNFNFHQTMWHPFVPNTLPSPYQYRYPGWYFSPLRSDVFKVFL